MLFISESLIEVAFVLAGAYKMSIPYWRVSGGSRGFESLPGKPVFGKIQVMLVRSQEFSRPRSKRSIGNRFLIGRLIQHF